MDGFLHSNYELNLFYLALIFNNIISPPTTMVILIQINNPTTNHEEC